MLKRLENKYRMFKAVIELLDHNRGLWEPVAVLATIISEFVTLFNRIEEVRRVTESDNTGITKEKEKLEAQLVDLTYQVSSALYVLATRSGNEELKQKSNYTCTELQSARENELVAINKSVLDNATIYLTALGEYGITSEEVATLGTLGNDYGKLVSAPRVSIAERKASNAKLKLMFDESSKMLEDQLDRMMVRFKNMQPDFYKSYVNARMLIEHGIRHEKEDRPEAA